MTTDLTVIAADERTAAESAQVAVDVSRWERLAVSILLAEGASGELTLTFVDTDEMSALNAEQMGVEGPTDVLSFPLDGVAEVEVPTLLGDVVICPGVAATQFADHAGTLEDELALLVVHGILHVLGHDHAEPDDAERMRARELELLVEHHWGSPPPSGFRQTHD